MYFVLPETKNVPLEELSALFGDADEVVLYSQDIVMDRNTHKLVLETHDQGAVLAREVTEVYQRKEEGSLTESKPSVFTHIA